MTGTETTPTTTSNAGGDAAARAAFVEAEKARRSLNTPATETAEDATPPKPEKSEKRDAPPADDPAAVEDATAVARVALRTAAAFFAIEEDGAADVAARFGRRVGSFLRSALGGWLGVLATVCELAEWAINAHMRARARNLPPKGGAS